MSANEIRPNRLGPFQEAMNELFEDLQKDYMEQRSQLARVVAAAKNMQTTLIVELLANDIPKNETITRAVDTFDAAVKEVK